MISPTQLVTIQFPIAVIGFSLTGACLTATDHSSGWARIGFTLLGLLFLFISLPQIIDLDPPLIALSFITLPISALCVYRLLEDLERKGSNP